MTRLLMSLVLIAACSGGKKSESTGPGSGTGSGTAILVKKIVISWGISPKGDLADIYLATTDETGKQISNSVGSYKGTCTPFKPDPEMTAITGVKCETGGGGTEIYASVQGGEEIVVTMVGFDAGRKADPMGRKEISRIKIPLGIAVEAAPL